MSIENTISVIGGAGHVGFPLALAFANKNYNVNIIDVDIENLDKIKRGIVPFYEVGAKKILNKCLKKKKFKFSNNLKTVKKSKYIVICIGTPINSRLQPETKEFFSFFSYLLKYISKNQIIIIRSSVFPGIIEKITKKFRKKNNNISYCPERIVQSKALIELPILPQIVSGVSKKSIDESSKLFKKITSKIIYSTIKEAELVKLYSNANRYINFAIANQLYLMCENQNINFENVKKIMQDGYERNINLPSAGFSAGPCLLKDTMQLRSFFKGNFELGYAAMKINEKGIVDLIIDKIKNIKNYQKKNIGLMGVAFKAETDDIRDSLSIKVLNKLKRMRLKVIFTDEYYSNRESYNLKNFIKKSDVIILGAPHKKYKRIRLPINKKYIDIWGLINKN
ncbi:nucleotide sugar dehydrogenase [Candidatus Pelagibacter sp.]|nr:nucleotide sugar dehydrogenase [Candidatus Pelagibacter sp.]